MKTLTVILLFVAIGCYAGDPSDITQKAVDVTNCDGILQHCVVTRRGKEMVMSEIYSPDAKGKLVINYRSYCVGGKSVMRESDNHKSGRLDTIVVHNPGTGDMEVFTRQADGSVKPVSTRELLAHKQMDAAVADVVRTLNDTNTTAAQQDQKIQDIQRKAKDALQQFQDAEKQKTNNNQ